MINISTAWINIFQTFNDKYGTLKTNCNFNSFSTPKNSILSSQPWQNSSTNVFGSTRMKKSILSELVGKKKQRNKSSQLILQPKVEALPSPCQMFAKKEENLNLLHYGANTSIANCNTLSCKHSPYMAANAGILLLKQNVLWILCVQRPPKVSHRKNLTKIEK